MKYRSLFWCLFLVWATTAGALPRLGVHAGYTRLVFDVPKQKSYKSYVSNNKVGILLSRGMKASKGKLVAPGLRSFYVRGKKITIYLAPKHVKARVKMLNSTKKDTSRLVIDVPSKGAKLGVLTKVMPIVSNINRGKTLKKSQINYTPNTNSFAKNKKAPTVVIDPGHGGRDPGMVSRYVTEKEITLKVSLKIKKLLEDKGVNVVLTRSVDKHLNYNKRLDLDLRSRMANGGKVTAFISIHVNAANPRVHGIETYYFGRPLNEASRNLAVKENGGGSIGQELTQKANNIAGDMLGDLLAEAKLSFSKQLAHKIQKHLIGKTGALSRGVRQNSFYVIRNPNTPAILTEIGFGSNPKEGTKLANPVYQSKIAQGITGAVLEFLHLQ